MEAIPLALFIGSWTQTSDILYDTVELASISSPQAYHETLKIPITEKSSPAGFQKPVPSEQANEDVGSTSSLDDGTGPQTGRIIHVHIDESTDNDLLPEIKHRHGTGFKSAASQWMQDCPYEWYVLKSYDFAAPRSSRDLWEVPPRRNIRHIFKEMVRNPERQWAQVMRRITTRKEKDGSLKVFISCKTMVRTARRFLGERRSSEMERTSSPFVLTAVFVEELRKLENVYCGMRCEKNWEKLFLLQYQHANLVVFANFLEAFGNDYVEPRRPNFDPRSSKLRGWVLEEMARDSYQYRQLTNIGSEMTDTLESLMDVVKSSLHDQLASASASASMAHFLALEPVLGGCCKDMRGRLARLTEEMESSLRFLELARTMRQSNDVQLLTVLAAFFLPLSLAAGVLSMQTRFKDLGVLLYDFFGVVCLLVTFAMAVILVLVCWAFLQETASRFMSERLLRPVWRVFGILVASGTLILGALIISSFLVGMLQDVVLGAKILGYGFAAAIGGPIACILPYLFFVVVYELFKDAAFTISSRMRKGRKEREKDPEGEPGQDTAQESILEVPPKVGKPVEQSAE